MWVSDLDNLIHWLFYCSVNVTFIALSSKMLPQKEASAKAGLFQLLPNSGFNVSETSLL
jgi:hypothetical protein